MAHNSCKQTPEVITRVPGQSVRSQFADRRVQYFSKFRAPDYSCEETSAIPYHPRSTARRHGTVDSVSYIGPRLTDEGKVAEMENMYRVFQAERDYLFDRSGWCHPLLYMRSPFAPPITEIHRIRPGYPKDNYPMPVYYSMSAGRRV